MEFETFLCVLGVAGIALAFCLTLDDDANEIVGILSLIFGVIFILIAIYAKSMRT